MSMVYEPGGVCPPVLAGFWNEPPQPITWKEAVQRARMAITRKKTDVGDLRPRSNPSSPKSGIPNNPAAHIFVVCLLFAVVTVPPVITVTITSPLCSALSEGIVDGLKLHEIDNAEGGTPGG